eukprot:2643396-Prymnesium_polylepis.1
MEAQSNSTVGGDPTTASNAFSFRLGPRLVGGDRTQHTAALLSPTDPCFGTGVCPKVPKPPSVTQ